MIKGLKGPGPRLEDGEKKRSKKTGIEVLNEMKSVMCFFFGLSSIFGSK